MADFVKTLTYLDLKKARKATLDDVSTNPTKNNKYFTLVGPLRAIKKIPYVITLPAYFLPYPNDAVIPQLIFQYNVTMPLQWGINKLRVKLTNHPITGDLPGGCITVKWRVGNVVSRYVLDGSPSVPSLLPNTQLNFSWYSGQAIPKNFCIEFWMSAPVNNPQFVGVYKDLILETTNLINPASPDQTEIHLQANAPITLQQLATVMPEPTPTDNQLNAWLDN